jgi:alkanesulfonate monooxygenase SsuD/methylene tetrahydromethanopterin reductase-like flavin-dependent oxidoreductase (luciferase family)
MKFGIFYELQLPRPWNEDSEYRLYKNALDQVELADRLGYDYAWEVEHHFLEEYSHSPAPEVFLAAASQRTRQIRLGHGIFQLTTNHPAKVAEKISVLDLISDGRVEFGMGESASVTELEDLRGSRPVPDPDVPAGRAFAQGPLLRLPGPQCPAQAAPETAPAAVGRLFAAGDHHLCW